MPRLDTDLWSDDEQAEFSTGTDSLIWINAVTGIRCGISAIMLSATRESADAANASRGPDTRPDHTDGRDGHL